MTKLAYVALLLIAAIEAGVAVQAQGAEPILSRSDIVTLSKIRHSLHNIADVKDQCSLFLQRANDKLNTAGPGQVAGTELLKSVAQELRNRKWPHVNVGLADYLDFCLEKAADSLSNVKEQQALPSVQKSASLAETSQVDPMTKLKAENEALKQKLGQMESEMRSLNYKVRDSERIVQDYEDIKSQLSKHERFWDLRTLASDYLACKRDTNDLKRELLQTTAKASKCCMFH